MTAPGPRLRVDAPVDGVVQIGRVVLRPTPATLPRPPRPPTPFLGRDGELAAIRSDASGSVVLHGLPGAGTTSLAARWAAGRGGPVVWVDVDDREEDGEVLTDLLGRLGLPPGRIPADSDERIALYRTVLAQVGTAVVIDDARSEATVRALAAPAGPTLVTARTSLPGLVVDGWRPVRLGGLDDRTGAALLRIRRPTGAGWCDDAAVVRLVRACDGTPGVLRLLAGVAPAVRGPDELAARLGPCPATSAVELAVDGLADGTARLLEVLRSRPDTSAAALGALVGADADDVAPQLHELVTRGLARAVADDGYRATPGPATARPDPPDHRGVAGDGAERPGDATRPHDDVGAERQGARRPAVDTERALVLAATSLRRAGDTAGEAAVVLTLARRARDAHAPGAGLAHAARAVDLFTDVGDGLGRAGALAEMAACLLEQGDATAAREAAGMALLGLPPDDPDTGWALVTDAVARGDLGDLDGERAALRRAIATFQRADHPRGRARAWRLLAGSLFRSGHGKLALDACRNAVRALPAAERGRSATLLAVASGELTAQVGGPVPPAITTSCNGGEAHAVEAMLRDVVGDSWPVAHAVVATDQPPRFSTSTGSMPSSAGSSNPNTCA